MHTLSARKCRELTPAVEVKNLSMETAQHQSRTAAEGCYMERSYESINSTQADA